MAALRDRAWSSKVAVGGAVTSHPPLWGRPANSTPERQEERLVGVASPSAFGHALANHQVRQQAARLQGEVAAPWLAARLQGEVAASARLQGEVAASWLAARLQGEVAASWLERVTSRGGCLT